MSCAYDIAYYIANTLGKGSLNSSVFVNYVPDTPNELIAVHGYGGKPSDTGMGNKNVDILENPSVQIEVRNSSSQSAETVITGIYKELDTLCDVTINSVSYLWMRAMQPPFILNRDERNRTTYVFNLEVQRRRP